MTPKTVDRSHEVILKQIDAILNELLALRQAVQAMAQEPVERPRNLALNET